MSQSSVLVSEVVARFLDDLLNVQRRSPKTVDLYRRMLKPWHDSETPVHDLTLEDCERLMRMRRPGSQGIAASALNGLFRFAKQQRWLPRSPMRDFEASLRGPRRQTALTQDQLRSLWQAAITSRRRPDENKLVLLLLMHGLTSGELVALEWDDLELSTSCIRSVTARGRHERVVALHPAAVNLLMAREASEPRVFPFNVASLCRRIKLLGRRAGIANLKPYQFRHTLTRNWMDRFLDADGLPSRGRWPIDRQRALDHGSRLMR